jgi:hypothetical protein
VGHLDGAAAVTAIGAAATSARRPPPFSAWRIAVSLTSAAAFEMPDQVQVPDLPAAELAEVVRAVGWLAGQALTSTGSPQERLAWLEDLGLWAVLAAPGS